MRSHGRREDEASIVPMDSDHRSEESFRHPICRLVAVTVFSILPFV
jgi:hypothetical protein